MLSRSWRVTSVLNVSSFCSLSSSPSWMSFLSAFSSILEWRFLSIVILLLLYLQSYSEKVNYTILTWLYDRLFMNATKVRALCKMHRHLLCGEELLFSHATSVMWLECLFFFLPMRNWAGTKDLLVEESLQAVVMSPCFQLPWSRYIWSSSGLLQEFAMLCIGGVVL